MQSSSAVELPIENSWLKKWSSLVKLSHTIFALPFALSMLVVLYPRVSISPEQIVFLIICLVAARSAAMAFNRVADADSDLKNPRTAMRDIPRGIISRKEAWGIVIGSSLLFMISAGLLGWRCFVLSPVVLAILFLYSATKRFTQFAHLVLGLGLAMAPGGVWFALTNEFSWEPVPLMIGVGLWVAGFDIIYSCQDVQFDRDEKLHSIPVKVGTKNALLISKLLHAAALLSLIIFGLVAELGTIYFLGLGVFAVIVASQHTLVSPDDFSKADMAFFTRNGLASVIFFLFVATDVILRTIFNPLGN